MPSSYSMQVIGHVESCFNEKFAIPRQPGLVPAATATIVLVPGFASPDSVRGLDAFSHLWLLFAFHATADAGWKPTVRPPKLGGNQRVGVFASRATHRPNPIGMSVAKLLAIDTSLGVRIHVGGLDVLDGTPVLDIKPYLPYADALHHASGGYADDGSDPLDVAFSAQASVAIEQYAANYPDLLLLIRQVLAQDPRPGYADDPQREYGMNLYDLNIRWRCDGKLAFVTTIQRNIAG